MLKKKLLFHKSAPKTETFYKVVRCQDCRRTVAVHRAFKDFAAQVCIWDITNHNKRARQPLPPSTSCKHAETQLDEIKESFEDVGKDNKLVLGGSQPMRLKAHHEELLTFSKTNYPELAVLVTDYHITITRPTLVDLLIPGDSPVKLVVTLSNDFCYFVITFDSTVKVPMWINYRLNTEVAKKYLDMLDPKMRYLFCNGIPNSVPSENVSGIVTNRTGYSERTRSGRCLVWYQPEEDVPENIILFGLNLCTHCQDLNDKSLLHMFKKQTNPKVLKPQVD